MELTSYYGNRSFSNRFHHFNLNFLLNLQCWSDLWLCRVTCIKVMHFSKKEKNQIAIRSVPTPAVLSSSPPTVARSLELLVGNEKPGGVWCYRLGKRLEYSVGGKTLSFSLLRCGMWVWNRGWACGLDSPMGKPATRSSIVPMICFGSPPWHFQHFQMVHLFWPAEANQSLSCYFFFLDQSHSIYALGLRPACKTPYEVGKLINGTVILRAQPCACLGAAQEWSSVNN